MKTKMNMSALDILIRSVVVVAIVILVVGKIVVAPLSIVLLVVAAVFSFTSITGFCPLYKIFGISSLKKKHAEK